MEADLQRFYGIDYRDRWRGTLSLRRIWVLIRHLPADAALSGILRGDKPIWTIEAYLLDDIRMMLTGEKKPRPHPTRPKQGPKVESPERQRKLADARRRSRERRQRIKAERDRTAP